VVPNNIFIIIKQLTGTSLLSLGKYGLNGKVTLLAKLIVHAMLLQTVWLG